MDSRNTKRINDKNNNLALRISSEIISHDEEKFAEIMKMDGINPKEVMASLQVEKNRRKLFKAGEGAGQSGSFFMHSYDNRLIIKTLRGSERKNLLKMLPDMIEHFKETKNRSLLCRIYGVYTIKTRFYEPVDIILMQNTLDYESKDSHRMVFDLKGSTQGRNVMLPHNPFFWRKDLNCDKVLKDINYCEINNDLDGKLMRIST